MKKELLFGLGILISIFIIIFTLKKPTVQISEATTRQNGVAFFRDKDSKEYVEINVFSPDSKPLPNVKVGYIDGKGFEFFQAEDTQGRYLPFLEVFPHNSIHSFTMYLPDKGSIIEKVEQDYVNRNQAIDKFEGWFKKNSEMVDLGIKTLEEWDEIADNKIAVVSIFLPKTGGKLKITGTLRQILTTLTPDASFSDPKQKYHIYSLLAFDGITSELYWLEEVEEKIENTITKSEINNNIKIKNRFLGTWKRIGGGDERELKYSRSFLKIVSVDNKYIAHYVTSLDAYRNHEIEVKLKNNKLIGDFYVPESVIIELCEPDKLYLTIDPLGEFVPIKKEVYQRTYNVEINTQDWYAEVIEKGIQRVTQPIQIMVDGQIYYLGKIKYDGQEFLAVTNNQDKIVNDRALLKKVFFVQHVYRIAYTSTKESNRIWQLDQAIEELQEMINMSYLTDAVLFIREISARALSEVILAASTGGTSVGKTVVKTSGKAIAKSVATSTVKGILNDPLIYLKCVNYLTIHKALECLQRAKRSISTNMKSNYLSYEDAVEVERDIKFGLSRNTPTRIFQAQLYLQQGGGGDIISQIQKIRDYMGDQLLGDIMAHFKYKYQIKIAELGYKISESIIEICPSYDKYNRDIQTAERDYGYETSQYYKSIIKPYIKNTNSSNPFTTNTESKVFPKPIGYVNDFEDILTKEQEKELTLIIKKHENETTDQIAIVTLISFEPYENIYEYSLYLANYWGVGQKKKNNGILIALGKGLRKIRIQNGFGIEKRLTDSETKKIIDEIMIPEFKDDNFYLGLKKGLEAIIEELK